MFSWFHGGLTICSSVSLYTGNLSWLLRNSIYFSAEKDSIYDSAPTTAAISEAPRKTFPAILAVPEDLTKEVAFERSLNRFIYYL